MALSKNNRKLLDKVLVTFGVVAMLTLLGMGGMAWWTHSFVSGNVHDQLASQKIYFPAAGSAAIAALPASDQAAMDKYAGQQLLTGAQAKVYANNFMAVHLSKIAGGQTYSEVSAKANADPSNQKLQTQANTLFKGETLRALLLGDAYAFSVVAQIAQIVAYVMFAAGGVMLVLVILGMNHLARTK